MMFAQQNTSAHAPSIALLEKGRTSRARPTETTPCLTTEMTVADPGALAGHSQLKAQGQHATVGLMIVLLRRIRAITLFKVIQGHRFWYKSTFY